LPLVVSSYPQWGEYLSKNGIQDPLLVLLQNKTHEQEKNIPLCEDTEATEEEFSNVNKD
jgi:hypothetical protein